MNHPGGIVNFVYEGEDEDVVFSLHGLDDAGKILPPEKEWRIGDEPVFSLDLPEGEYWLAGTLPKLTDNSQKIEFCLGVECELPVEEETEPSAEDISTDEEEPKGGCQASPIGAQFLLLWGVLAYRRRS